MRPGRESSCDSCSEPVPASPPHGAHHRRDCHGGDGVRSDSTIVGAWNAGVTGAAANRMITPPPGIADLPDPAPLPERDCQGAGVTGVSVGQLVRRRLRGANDFKNSGPGSRSTRTRTSDLYPEFSCRRTAGRVKKERNACVIGRKLAQQHGFKLGDVITMEGDIYPGTWQWVARGSTPVGTRLRMRPRMFFQFAYLFEQVRQRDRDVPWTPGFTSCASGRPTRWPGSRGR